MEILVALSGASGVRYGLRLAEVLEEGGHGVHRVATRNARRIMEIEEGSPDTGGPWMDEGEMDAGFASGSYRLDAMVVCPCSMKTLSAVANGFASNLVTRAADVMIKEGRPLVLVPRETPISAIHLENMLKLARLGVTILPAMPGFYHRPEGIEDLVDFVVGKVLDSLGIDHDLFKRWGLD
ncbi:MAG: UbiX family flavin prenyltransferase [Euryarchaeota archaeon]|nr:UbiX family flavin prenyltransferase [Euryarchaeota archaeon]